MEIFKHYLDYYNSNVWPELQRRYSDFSIKDDGTHVFKHQGNKIEYMPGANKYHNVVNKNFITITTKNMLVVMEAALKFKSRYDERYDYREPSINIQKKKDETL